MAKRSRKSEKFFDFGTAVGLVLAILTSYMIYLNLPTEEESADSQPPQFSFEKSPFLGSLDANNCIPLGLEYTEDDVDNFELPASLENSDENPLLEGINFYHHSVYEEGFMSVQDIMDAVVPVEDNRVFFVHYSNGYDGLDIGFHIYPELPEGTDTSGSSEDIYDIDDPENLIIFPNLAFGIYSCMESSIYEVLDQSVPGISTYTDPDTDTEYITAPELVVSPDGWISMMVPDDMTIGEYFACNGHKIKSIWVQDDESYNGFLADYSFSNVNDAELQDDVYTVWLNIGDNPEFEEQSCDNTGHVIDEDEVVDANEGDSDAPLCAGLHATIYVQDNELIAAGPHKGELWEGVLEGTEEDDVIVGTKFEDTIHGLGGNDIICGGESDDEIDGGEGEDILYGESGNDQLLGQESFDILVGGVGDDILFGHESDDLIFGGEGEDEIYGQDGDDYICGGLNDDFIEGEAGNDRIDAGDYDDMEAVNGGEGEDKCNNETGVYLQCESEDFELPECDESLDFYQEMNNASSVFNSLLGYILENS